MAFSKWSFCRGAACGHYCDSLNLDLSTALNIQHFLPRTPRPRPRPQQEAKAVRVGLVRGVLCYIVFPFGLNFASHRGTELASAPKSCIVDSGDVEMKKDILPILPTLIH